MREPKGGTFARLARQFVDQGAWWVKIAGHLSSYRLFFPQIEKPTENCQIGVENAKGGKVSGFALSSSSSTDLFYYASNYEEG